VSAAKRVIEVTAADIQWSFNDGKPRVKVGYLTEIDPFAAYPHDVRLVRESLRATEHAFRAAHPPTIFVLHHEALARTNGWAQPETEYDADTGKSARAPGYIVLSGKRIPPHPAVTRYVVPHEYGHHVQYEVQDRRGMELHGNGILPEYAQVRGLDYDAHSAYGGGCWHSNIGELFANDFRILVADAETDFWPHPGFKRPERVKGLAAWWKENLS
jgi:hypothetical protein